MVSVIKLVAMLFLGQFVHLCIGCVTVDVGYVLCASACHCVPDYNEQVSLTLASLRGKTPPLRLRGGGHNDPPLESHISAYTVTPMLFFLYSTLQMRKKATKIRCPTYIPFV